MLVPEIMIVLDKRARNDTSLTLGILIVLMIVLLARFHKRRVLSEILPRLGFRIESGTMKSEVRMRFFSKSTDSPCGLNKS